MTKHELVDHISNERDTFAAVMDINVARYLSDRVKQNKMHHDQALALVEHNSVQIPISILLPRHMNFNSLYQNYSATFCIEECIRWNEQKIKFICLIHEVFF